MSDLKPCPFCGYEAKIFGGPMDQETYSVWCTNDNGIRHHIDCGTMDKDKARDAWNTRATPAPGSCIKCAECTCTDGNCTWIASWPVDDFEPMPAPEQVWQEAMDADAKEFEHRKEWFTAICDDMQSETCGNVIDVIRTIPNPYAKATS